MRCLRGVDTRHGCLAASRPLPYLPMQTISAPLFRGSR
jgi:hypothetical protein